MHYVLLLFALNGLGFVTLAFASCDVSFCVSQFCPPSVGDVGLCLCVYNGANALTEVLACLHQECGGSPGDIYPSSNVTSCCDAYDAASQHFGVSYVPLAGLAACTSASIQENPGQSVCTTYTPSYNFEYFFTVPVIANQPYLCTNFNTTGSLMPTTTSPGASITSATHAIITFTGAPAATSSSTTSQKSGGSHNRAFSRLYLLSVTGVVGLLLCLAV